MEGAFDSRQSELAVLIHLWRPAVGAALAVKQGISPADIDPREVRSELAKRGGVLRVQKQAETEQ